MLHANSWEQRKLGDIGKTFTGLSGKTSNDFGHGEAKFLPYLNIFNNPIADVYFLESTEIDKSQNEIKYGDVFFTTSSETPEEVGMSSVWLGNSGNIYLNSFCFGFRPLIDFNPYYFGYLLRSDSFRKPVTVLAQGISRFNISKNKVMEINIPLPEKLEQEKIGQLFYKLDSLITLHQRKCEKLQAVKKGLLDKMFPAAEEREPKIRFKGFTEAWEQRKFEDVAVIRRGLTYSPSDIKNTGIRVLRSSNIDEEYFVKFEDDVFVDKNCINIPFVNNGDILITSANGSSRLVGKHAIIHDLRHNSAVHGGFMLLASSKNPYFVNASMSAAWYKKFIDLYVAGGNGAIGNLNKNDLDNYELMIPTNNEQIKIGELFKNLDTIITLHQRTCEKLKNLKSGLLNKMFC